MKGQLSETTEMPSGQGIIKSNLHHDSEKSLFILLR